MSKNPIFVFFLIALTASAQSDEFSYAAFRSGATIPGPAHGPNITLNGISEVQPTGILRLTNVTSRLIGRAFYPSALTFKNSTTGLLNSFSAAFVFAVVPEYPTLGGHGLAFTIAPTKELKGAQPSQYLGLLNSSDNSNATDHVFAVEFDTVQDFEFGDINDNHVGVDLNSLSSSAAASVAYFDDNGVKTDLVLKGGHKVQAWVDYDGVAKVLNVTVAPFSNKPTKPLISFPVDLSTILQDEMFVGFSASTGLLASSHYLFAFSFKMNGVAKSFDLSSLPSLPEPKRKNTTLIVAVSLSSVIVLAVAAAIASYLFYKIKTADIIEAWERTCGPHRFSYSELKKATKGFGEKELLGFGGFGKVYKGTLPTTGAEVAVKRVSHESRQGIQEFVAEIASIGRLRHRNLVQLLGWCRRRKDLILVYDYMENGSLDKFLFPESSSGAGTPQLPAPKDRPALTWPQRLRILRGVASALLYLHEEWEHVVIHRDVKASNVLLDGDLNGRLGDFGLAKLYEHGANPSTTRVVGTLGYLAPELARTGKATTRSDVFAFGAVALEVVCGRRPIDPRAVPEELVLVDWVWERWSAGAWTDVVDPQLAGEYEAEEVAVAVKVGLLCSHPWAGARPTMREVVRYLEGGDAAGVPDVPSPPPEYEDGSKGRVRFEDFVHSYPSSSFEKLSLISAGSGSVSVGKEGVGPNYSPLGHVSV